MAKFNFKKALLDGDNKPLKDGEKELILSELLSGVIFGSRMTECSIKFFDWGLELKKSGALTLDKTDTQALKDYILSHPALSVLEKGRYNEVLSEGV